MLIRNCQKSAGFAALFATLIILGVVLVVGTGLSLIALNEQKITKNSLLSSQAYYLAESGIQDSLYRIIKGKNYQATNSLDIGPAGLATINISDLGNQKIIQVSGEEDNRFRKLKVVLAVSTDAVSFHYGVQVGEGGLEMENGSQVLGNIYSNGSIHGDNGATITGDAFVATGMTQDQIHAVYNSDQIFGQANPVIDITQSFKPSFSGNLVKVSIYLKKVGTPGDKTVRILTDSSNSPSKTSLASATLRSSLVGTSYGWIDVVFPSPPNLIQNTTYWLMIDASKDSDEYWSWGKDQNQGYGNGQAKYSQDWDAENPNWTSIEGDLDLKTLMGGQMTSLEGVIINGNSHANTISSSQVCGDAYYQTIDTDSLIFANNPRSPICSEPLTPGIAFPGSSDPPLQNMPISDSNIEQWKLEATNGGVYPGDLEINSDMSYGPKKINGDLLMNHTNKTLTVNGTIYVTGSINIDNGSTIRCAASYGLNSCIVVTDKWIHIKNNGEFKGSGQSGSYLMILTTSPCDGTWPWPGWTTCTDHNAALDLHNNALGAIFYANNGYVYLHNGVNISELVAQKIQLEQNAVIRYEKGLENAQFSVGPGATWAVKSWEEKP